MKYSRSLVSLALVASLGIGTALAQTPPSGDTGAPSFSDLSKDGKTLKRGDLPKDVDALKELRAHFGEADTNKDGKLDKGEYDAYLSKNSPQAQQQQQRH